MDINNETIWRTDDLGALLKRCQAWLGLDGSLRTWCRVLYVRYSRQDQTTGYAYMHGGSVTLRIPHPYPSPASRIQRGAFVVQTPEGPKIETTRTLPPRVNAIGEMRPDLFADLCWTVEHEMLHVLGWDHSRMRREKHPAYRWRVEPALRPPGWADEVPPLAVRVRPAQVKGPKLTPADRAARRAEQTAARVEERDRRLRASLTGWQRKLKLAQTKVRKLKAKLAAAERRRARAMIAEVADAVPEHDEPPLCSCGKHYVGAACPGSPP